MEADRSSSCLFFIGRPLRGSQCCRGDPAKLLTLCWDSGTGFVPRTACSDPFLHLCPCADSTPRRAGAGRPVASWVQQGHRPGKGSGRPVGLTQQGGQEVPTGREGGPDARLLWQSCSPAAAFQQKESGRCDEEPRPERACARTVFTPPR